MELMPGYKYSDIGYVPEEWDVKRLCNFASVATGSTPPTSDATNYGEDFLFVSPVDMGEAKLITRTEKKLSPKGFSMSRKFPRGSILFVCIGSTIGKCGIASTELTSNQQINAIFPSPIFSEDYLYYAMAAASPRVRALAGEQAVPLVNKTQFSETYVPLPPLPEQRAIAQALSDVDALLATLDQVIAKKRDLKQAAMQQLLTGQARLPGFSGEWKEKTLGELGEITGAGVDKKIHLNEMPVRLLNYMDVYKKDFLKADDFWHEVTAKPDQVKRCAVQRGDVFFTPTSEVRDDIGHSAVAIEDAPDVVYSYHVVRLRLSEVWDIGFRAYAFKAKRFLDQASTQCEGSGTRYVITLPKFRAMTVQYPAEIEEQKAIAAVLSDMDSELAALEARRDKTRNLKQAMMQELLTGKTRLMPKEHSHV